MSLLSASSFLSPLASSTDISDLSINSRVAASLYTVLGGTHFF